MEKFLMKIKAHRYGVIHYVAQCDTCGWNDAGITEAERESVRYRTRKHVEETGHEVNVESGSSTTYKRVP